jgi:hypothetical protein
MDRDISRLNEQLSRATYLLDSERRMEKDDRKELRSDDLEDLRSMIEKQKDDLTAFGKYFIHAKGAREAALEKEKILAERGADFTHTVIDERKEARLWSEKLETQRKEILVHVKKANYILGKVFQEQEKLMKDNNYHGRIIRELLNTGVKVEDSKFGVTIQRTNSALTGFIKHLQKLSRHCRDVEHALITNVKNLSPTIVDTFIGEIEGLLREFNQLIDEQDRLAGIEKKALDVIDDTISGIRRVQKNLRKITSGKAPAAIYEQVGTYLN